jgi:hypothetical protein
MHSCVAQDMKNEEKRKDNENDVVEEEKNKTNGLL